MTLELAALSYVLGGPVACGNGLPLTTHCTFSSSSQFESLLNGCGKKREMRKWKQIVKITFLRSFAGQGSGEVGS